MRVYFCSGRAGGNERHLFRTCQVRVVRLYVVPGPLRALCSVISNFFFGLIPCTLEALTVIKTRAVACYESDTNLTVFFFSCIAERARDIVGQLLEIRKRCETNSFSLDNKASESFLRRGHAIHDLPLKQMPHVSLQLYNLIHVWQSIWGHESI